MIAVGGLLASCAGLTAARPDRPTLAYLPAASPATAAPGPPLFVIGASADSYNRIGKPVARRVGDDILVSVDSGTPMVYWRENRFETSRGSYRNLIYRVHFEKVPFSLLPFYVSAGRNVGLIVIVTIDARGLPVLVTTVHTCGCYLAIFPTSYLPPEAYPADWDPAGQRVWGENLPGLIDIPENSSEPYRFLVFLRDGNHRVRDIRAEPMTVVRKNFSPAVMDMAAMEELEELPLADGSTVSLFETAGLRKGYVRGSYKPWEMLLVSWWALDLYVGSDKAYGRRDETGNTFYTSLKPWNRTKSDMGDFPAFLRFWGWRL